MHIQYSLDKFYVAWEIFLILPKFTCIQIRFDKLINVPIDFPILLKKSEETIHLYLFS